MTAADLAAVAQGLEHVCDNLSQLEAEAQAAKAEKALLAGSDREEAFLMAAQTAKSNRKGKGKGKGKKGRQERYPAGGVEDGASGRREEVLAEERGGRGSAPGAPQVAAAAAARGEAVTAGAQAPAAPAAMGGGAIVDGPREIARTAEVEAETGRAQTPNLSDAMAATGALAVMRLDEGQFDEEAFLLEGAPDTIVGSISMVLMTEACVAGDGFSFNRPALQAWIERCKATGQVLRSPKTGESMPEITLPNQNIRTQVVEWIE